MKNITQKSRGGFQTHPYTWTKGTNRNQQGHPYVIGTPLHLTFYLIICCGGYSLVWLKGMIPGIHHFSQLASTLSWKYLMSSSIK